MNVRSGGRYLLAKRISLRWTQEQLVDTITRYYHTRVVSQKDVSRIERGQIQEPSFEKIVLIGAALGIPCQELVTAYEIFTKQ